MRIGVEKSLVLCYQFYTLCMSCILHPVWHGRSEDQWACRSYTGYSRQPSRSYLSSGIRPDQEIYDNNVCPGIQGLCEQWWTEFQWPATHCLPVWLHVSNLYQCDRHRDSVSTEGRYWFVNTVHYNILNFCKSKRSYSARIFYILYWLRYTLFCKLYVHACFRMISVLSMVIVYTLEPWTVPRLWSVTRQGIPTNGQSWKQVKFAKRCT